MAQAQYFLGRYDDAVAAGRQALALIPDNPLALRFTAAGLGQLGRTQECGPLVASLRDTTAPSVSAIGRSIEPLYRLPAMIEHLLDGLRKAGLN